MAPSNKAKKGMLDGLVVLVLLALVAVVVAALGLPGLPAVPAPVQTAILAAVAAALAGASFLFNAIDWKELQAAEAPRILDRARADIILTIVSIGALFTVVIMVVFEVFALLVFLELVDVGAAGAGVAANFVLVQTILLLVYLLALIARQANPSRYAPRPASRVLALVLTPAAVLAMALGTLLAFAPGLAGLRVSQAVYVVTLGVLLEFIAMRIRLALPSLWSFFAKAMKDARRPDPEMQHAIRRRAVRVYVAASVFVTLSMALVGALATGTVGEPNPALLWAVAVFYSIGALVLLGMVGLRLMQHRTIDRPAGEEGDELSALVSQKRRSPEEVVRIAVYAVTGLVAGIAGLLTVFTALDSDFIPWDAKFATDLFILACMFGAGPAGIFYNRERKRIAAIDEKFPDFLRDLAESARAGMTLPKALVTAAEGSYGALTPEIKTMAAQVQWGVEFGDALRRFALRCKTPLIDRTVALVVEAQRAGGSVIDVLTAASEDAREIKQIVSERTAQMSMYNVVIYIAYFVFIVVVLVLALQFIPAFKGAVLAAGGGGGGQQVSGGLIKDFDVEDFNTVFFQAAVVQAIGGGLVGGVLTRGSPVAGFPHIGIMLFFAWLAFRVGVGVLQGEAPA